MTDEKLFDKLKYTELISHGDRFFKKKLMMKYE